MKNRISRAQIEYTRGTANPHLAHSAENIALEIEKVLQLTPQEQFTQVYHYPNRYENVSDDEYFQILITKNLLREALLYCYFMIGSNVIISRNSNQTIQYKVVSNEEVDKWEKRVRILEKFDPDTKKQ